MSGPLTYEPRPGRHDPVARRRAVRGGRMRGCSLNISAEELLAAGIDPTGPPPYYRVWPAKGRPRLVINLYTEA